MFQSTELADHLRTSDTIKTETSIYAEWNMNRPGNIARLGNYRYRPTYTGSQYFLIPMNYDPIDSGYYYTDATDSDIAIDSGFDDNDDPTLFISKKEKMKLLYSLEDCIKPHRPRSGINKPLYLGNIGAPYSQAQYITNPSPINSVTDAQELNQGYIVNRPRYYMGHRDDIFKYWTSYRTEYGMPTPRPGQVDAEVLRQVERGISFSQNNQFYIEDAAPFVVYNDQIPTNKIVVKMQTNVGDINLGNVRYGNESIPDPLYGTANQTTPTEWRIEKLNADSSWEIIAEFDSTSLDEEDNPIIGPDGYIEISYGLQLPDQYKDVYVFADTITSATLLPEVAPEGYAYLVKESEHDLGTMWIYYEDDWESFVPDYSWQLSNEEISHTSNFVTQPANPDYFINVNGNVQFREFEFINGIRIVVKTMNKANCTFDLIEFSPRLIVDIGNIVQGFNVTKSLSDLGNGSIPVGSLSVSVGQLDIFDTDFSFNQNNTFDPETNTGSILAPYLDMPVKFLFYDIVRQVNGYDYFIPVKSMYSESFPQSSGTGAIVSIQLRDFFFYLESTPAPQLLLTDVSLSWAITVLMDYIGFSNYTFKRIAGYPEMTIPYFFVEPDQNCAEVLQKLAIASQSAMFFDEYNNLVVMSKEYLLPSSADERATDMTLYGQVEDSSLPNIVNLSSDEKKVYNDGQINYTTRYIQRSIGSTQTAQKLDQYKQYIYKPVLLWEVPGRETLKTINDLVAQNSGYTLGAVPLNTNLTADLPYVRLNTIYNNIIDVGENIFWIPSCSGYFYANGEIIRYDAIEFAITGQAEPIWITSNQQYQDYMASLPFNGKMYATGNVRIYTKPEYEIIDDTINLKDGVIKEHGRGQFGTPVTQHIAGLTDDNYWTNSNYVGGCIMDSAKYLFTTNSYVEYPTTMTTGIAGKIQETPYVNSDIFAQSSTRNGIIKNFLADKYYAEEEINYLKTTGPGTIQASGLVFNGPVFGDVSIPEQGVPSLGPSSFISYVYKDFVDQNGQSIPYKHFGTRMRVVGRIEGGTEKSQTPSGSYPIFEGSAGENLYSSSGPLVETSSDQQVKIYGGSGGIGIGVNKQTNNGYFFEIVALTADNVESYVSDNNANANVAKILSSPAPSCTNNVVTVNTESQVNFQVGQRITISGLVDANDPLNTRTKLNGEYVITAVNTNKKSFQYTIDASPALTTTSSTGGIASSIDQEETNISNIYFYKIVSDGNGNAIPYRLWRGLAQINVDSGEFLGQNRLAGESSTTVYDLSVEYSNIGSSRRFYLYMNGKQIATVDDTNPLPEFNNMVIFTRGSSRCIFENVYALANNYSQNTSFTAQKGISAVFGDGEVDATEALRKYALSGIIQKTYLSGISSAESPQYLMYFEEFGTILRECAYFNIKYDRAYPALYAKMMKTLNRVKGYSVSGFYAGSYGADFLVFNCTDFNLNLDDTSGNYLRIQGVAFTQNTTYTLTVDEYFKNKSTVSETELGTSSTITNPFRVIEEYNRIKNSRIRYGVNQFTPIDSPYIQSTDVAEGIFGWVVDKVSVPKKVVGLNLFGTNNMQIGDIVNIDYKDQQGLGIDIISPQDKRFVVYNIEYKKSFQGIETTAYLVEV